MTIAWQADEHGAKKLRFALPDGAEIVAEVERLLLAGYAGRSGPDVAKHVTEMRALGVPVPDAVPVFYRAMTSLLTQGSRVEAVGADTRPEVEFVLFSSDDTWFVTVGNDQSDLVTERQYSAEKSKNLCQKAIAQTAWPLEELEAHWDELILELSADGIILQNCSVASLLRPRTLIEQARRQRQFRKEGGMLFSGTVPTLQETGPEVVNFSMTLFDPVLGRQIGSTFCVTDITSAHNQISQFQENFGGSYE